MLGVYKWVKRTVPLIYIPLIYNSFNLTICHDKRVRNQEQASIMS